MLSINRKFHFYGELTIKKSKYLKLNLLPKDDETNWLFIELQNGNYSFVYKILDPENAEYEIPFKILIAFTFIEQVKESINLNKTYNVIRGQEPIGYLKLIDGVD